MNKDTLVRALKTFWQTALGYLVTMLGTYFTGVDPFDAGALKAALIGLAISALAAGFSAAWNGVIAPLFSKAPVEAISGEDSEEDLNEK